jgi:hypothetical protein
MTEKVCTKCGIKKDLSLFHNDKMNKDGKTSQCAECRKRNGKNNRVDILSVYATMTDDQIYESLGDKKKICPSCDEKKEPKEFQIDRHKRGGLFTYCRECGNSRCRVYSKENSEKQKIRFKKYRYDRSNDPEYKYKQYKSSCSRIKRDFQLSYEEFLTLWKKDCSYCGSTIDSVGIDRVNSSIGYILDNCVPCCFDCNGLKSNRELDKWLDKMEKILKFRGKI